MTIRFLAVLALSLLAGSVAAQSNSGYATTPSYEPEVTGPADSTGTVGESPTKSMLNNSDRLDTPRRPGREAESSGDSGEQESREAMPRPEGHPDNVSRPTPNNGN